MDKAFPNLIVNERAGGTGGRDEYSILNYRYVGMILFSMFQYLLSSLLNGYRLWISMKKGEKRGGEKKGRFFSPCSIPVSTTISNTPSGAGFHENFRRHISA